MFANAIYTMALGFQRGWKLSAAVLPQWRCLQGPREELRGAAGASECLVNTPEGSTELATLAMRRAPGRARAGRWGRRDSKKKRGLLSVLHRAVSSTVDKGQKVVDAKE